MGGRRGRHGVEVGKGEGEAREMEEERRGKGEGRGEEGGPKMQEPQATGAHGASRENSPAGPGDGDGFPLDSQRAETSGRIPGRVGSTLLYSLTTEALNTAARASQPCDLPEKLLVWVTFKASLALATHPACNSHLPPGSWLSAGKGSLLAGGHLPLSGVRSRRRGGDRQGPTLLARPLLQTPDSISVLSVSTYLLLTRL